MAPLERLFLDNDIWKTAELSQSSLKLFDVDHGEDTGREICPGEEVLCPLSLHIH